MIWHDFGVTLHVNRQPVVVSSSQKVYITIEKESTYLKIFNTAIQMNISRVFYLLILQHGKIVLV